VLPTRSRRSTPEVPLAVIRPTHHGTPESDASLSRSPRAREPPELDRRDMGPGSAHKERRPGDRDRGTRRVGARAPPDSGAREREPIEQRLVLRGSPERSLEASWRSGRVHEAQPGIVASESEAKARYPRSATTARVVGEAEQGRLERLGRRYGSSAARRLDVLAAGGHVSSPVAHLREAEAVAAREARQASSRGCDERTLDARLQPRRARVRRIDNETAAGKLPNGGGAARRGRCG